MKDDVPAAHSMDTEWFAVDAEGRVAMFDTDEPGPMPEEAFGGQGIAWEILPTLSEVPYDLSGLDLVADGQLIGASGEMLVTTPQGTISGLFWLAGEGYERVQPLERLYRLKGDGGQLLVLGDLPAETLGLLRRDGLFNRGWIVHELDMSRFGFFTYRFREPYERTAAPGRPITIDRLPATLGEEMRQLTLSDVSFPRDASIEPRLFVSCNAWSDDDSGGGPGWLAGKSWLAIDGKGQVAIFDTGDGAAAVPFHVGFRRVDRADVIHRLTEAEPFHCDVADLLVDPDGAVHRWGQAPALAQLDAHLGTCLLWLADESVLELARSRAPIRRCHVPDHWLGWGVLFKAQLEGLLAEGVIRKAWIHCQLDAARVGLFVYEGEEQDPSYLRQVAPTTPVLVDALPEKTRAWLGQWRFPEVDFARDASFDPRRFVECICGEEGLRAGPDR
jgi:hypothetical protein